MLNGSKGTSRSSKTICRVRKEDFEHNSSAFTINYKTRQQL